MGEDVKKIRTYLNLSQCNISYSCGLGPNYIAHIESGKIKNISFKNAYKIAFFFIQYLKEENIDIKLLEQNIGDCPLLDLMITLQSKNKYNYDFYYS